MVTLRNSRKMAESGSINVDTLACCSAKELGASLLLHQFAESLGNAIDAKDPCTSMHSDEVADVSMIIARSMGYGKRQAEAVHIAGHLHDIGKIGVPDCVLKKKGALTVEEWALIREHPKAGAAILRPVAILASLGVVDMVLHHHERFDGRGYPHGLAGTEIPEGARIIAVADSLSAMLQNRPYRGARSFDFAAREVVSCSGEQFDPSVVHAFMHCADEVQAVLEKR